MSNSSIVGSVCKNRGCLNSCVKISIGIFEYPTYNDSMRRKIPPNSSFVLLQQGNLSAWSRLLTVRFGITLQVIQIREESLGMVEKRYWLRVEGQEEELTAVVQRVAVREAQFYRDMAASFPHLVARCWLAEVGVNHGWVVLDDLSHDHKTEEWDSADSDQIITTLAHFHASYWDKKAELTTHRWLPYSLGSQRLGGEPPPSATEQNNLGLSFQAQRVLGTLAPRWIKAAEGVRSMLEVDGWSGVVDERMLRAAADLIDDPLPLLHQLRHQPNTLLHGYPGVYNWRMPLWGTPHLVDWQKVGIGPGVCDLVVYLETYDLLQDGKAFKRRTYWPLDEETAIDSYLLTLSADLGAQCNTREVRRSIPAARCLHILLHWFPRFQIWLEQLPAQPDARREMWQFICQGEGDDEMGYRPMLALRPFLTEVFQRFLRAYYQLP